MPTHLSCSRNVSQSMKVAGKANFVVSPLQLTDLSPHGFVMLSSGSEKSCLSIAVGLHTSLNFLFFSFQIFHGYLSLVSHLEKDLGT